MQYFMFLLSVRKSIIYNWFAGRHVYVILQIFIFYVSFIFTRKYKYIALLNKRIDRTSAYNQFETDLSGVIWNWSSSISAHTPPMESRHMRKPRSRVDWETLSPISPRCNVWKSSRKTFFNTSTTKDSTFVDTR